MRTRPSPLLLAWLALIALGIALIYLPGLGNAPIFDDDYLASGELMREFASPTLRQRLLSYGSFLWVQGLFGDGLWKQRLVNVLLHAATVAAVWAFWRELLEVIVPERDAATDAPQPAGEGSAFRLGMLFFALNPVAVYAVGYLIQRSIVMATGLVALALWAFVRGLRRKSIAWHVAAAVLYLLAVAAKESAIAAPLAAIPVYVVVSRPSLRRLSILAAIAVAALGAIGLLIRMRSGPIIGIAIDEYSVAYLKQLAALDPHVPARGWPLSIENQAWLFFEYGFRWMVPWSGWMSVYPRPPFPIGFLSFPQALGVVGYLAVIAAGAWLVARYRDARAVLGLALLVPAALFTTEFLILWVQDPFVLYRSYLWAIGIPALVFALFNGLPARAGLAAGAAVAGLLCWQGLDRVLSMDTVERAWTDAIRKMPDDPRSVGRWVAYLNRGANYVERDELDLALRDFQASEALGDGGMGAFNAGSVLAAQGHHPEALLAFARAESQGYALYNLYVQRGLSLLALRRPQEAYAQLERARAMNPPSPTREVMLLNLGRLELQLGNPAKAAADLEALLARDPKPAEARYLLAMAYIGRGEAGRALAVVDKLIAETGGTAPDFYARALAHQALRQRDAALADIEQAILRDPASPALKDMKARILAMPRAG